MWMLYDGPIWTEPPPAPHMPLSWREIHLGWTREQYTKAMDAFLAPAPPQPNTTINRATNSWWTNKGADMTKTAYVVVDSDGHVSYDEVAEAPQKFGSFTSARSRAEELAQSQPGDTISIYKLAAETACAVGEPETKTLPV